MGAFIFYNSFVQSIVSSIKSFVLKKTIVIPLKQSSSLAHRFIIFLKNTIGHEHFGSFKIFNSLTKTINNSSFNKLDHCLVSDTFQFLRFMKLFKFFLIHEQSGERYLQFGRNYLLNFLRYISLSFNTK